MTDRTPPIGRESHDAATEPVRKMTYALVRGEQYVHVGQLARRLQEAGWDDIATWLLSSSQGEVVRRVNVRR